MKNKKKLIERIQTPGERESSRGVNVEDNTQQASSGDGVFSGSCDSGQNKGRLDSAALLWIVSTV